MIDWIRLFKWAEEHLEVITKIAIPIMVAVIGLFKVKQLIKKQQIKSRGNRNNILTAEQSINNQSSFNNYAQSAEKGALQIIGNNNQVGNLDIRAVQIMAEVFNKNMYPYAERAFEKLKLNSQSFLAILNSELEQLSLSELDKFSEADVQMSLMNALKGSVRTSSIEVHQLLSRLIMDRVQKPHRSITELVINESIEVAAKLDANLIKILGLSFMFSRTKYMLLTSEEELISRLLLVTLNFKNLEVTSPKFEYLESISCGKISNFVSRNLVKFISINYPHLFLKKVSIEQVTTLSLPVNIQEACFIKSNNDIDFKLNPYIGLYLFEDASVNVQGTPFSIQDDTIKEQLKIFFRNSAQSEKEIKDFIIQRLPDFESIIEVWDKNDFVRFSLTAVGIAIGRAYLEQSKIGNYDINLWIN